MNKISRVDALLAVAEALQSNDTKKANDIMNIVSRVFVSDKRNNTFTEQIVLHRKEKKIFQK